MSSFWQNNDFDDLTLARLGPFLDGVVGTEGEYTDLYAAIAAGWTKMILTPSATLSQNLTISGHNGFIWSLHMHEFGALNDHKITVSGSYWKFVGIKLFAGAAGWELQGSNYDMINCSVVSGSSHGLYINSSNGGFKFLGCTFRSNAGDGIKIVSTSTYNDFVACDSHTNAGWGVNTAVTGSGFPIFAGCRLGVNTLGSANGTITEGNYKP